MKTFTDNTGRVWMLAVNVGAIKRVRALCGVDLNSIIELDEKNKPSAKLLERLSTDPVLLVDVLYAVCKAECDQKGVTDEDFGMAMGADAVEYATTALLDEIIDFFRLRNGSPSRCQWGMLEGSVLGMGLALSSSPDT